MKSANTRYRRLGFERFEDRLLLALDPVDSTNMLQELISSQPAELAPVEDVAVRFRLQLTDSANVPISTVKAGDEFNLNVYVIDQRPVPLGVFAAYLDLTFEADRVERTGQVVFSELFENVANSGGTRAGLLDEVGATATISSLANGDIFPQSRDEALLFRVPFRAIESGPVNFRASPANVLPSSDVLLFGVDHRIGAEQIVFDTVSLNVVTPAATLQSSSLPAVADSVSSVDRGPAVGSFVSLPSPGFASRSSSVLQADSPLQGLTPVRSRSERWDARGEVSSEPQFVPKAWSRPDDAGVQHSGWRTEAPRANGGFIELDLPAFKKPGHSLGSSSSWREFPDGGRESSIANSKSLFDTPDAITRQRVFGRRFLRISWDELFESGDASDSALLGGMIDIGEIAYETIRAEDWDEAWDPISLRALADDDSSEEAKRGEPDAETLAIDTLFSLGVELQAARGWRLAIDVATDDDEMGLAKSDETTTHSEQEADAGPPHPPRLDDGETAKRPA